MNSHVDAVYEKGVFRPLKPVTLPEHQRVTVTIDAGSAELTEGHVPVQFSLSAERWQAFCGALDAPPKVLPRLKKLLTQASLFAGNGTGAS